MGEDESSKQMFDDDANDLLILVAGLRHHGSLPGNAWQPFTGQYQASTHLHGLPARPPAHRMIGEGDRPPTQEYRMIVFLRPAISGWPPENKISNRSI